MENKNKKCSSKSHKEINATCYCFNCKIYMCNKCNKLHSELFDNHTSYNLDKEINESFTGFCTEDTHSMKLKYYCKNHNKLCCAACIAKIQDKENGQHKNCDVCNIDVIIDEKKAILEENIKYLENISNDLEQLINDIKLKYEKINVNKEELKLKIQNTFTNIRIVLNEREDELLYEIDKFFNNNCKNEDIIKENEKLPNKIKISLEKGKMIINNWNEKNILSNINDCFVIENNVETIKKLNNKIRKDYSNLKLDIALISDEKDLNNLLENIKSIIKIHIDDYKYIFKQCPKDAKKNKKYIISGENNNIITKIGSFGWMGAVCENEFEKSKIYKWKIKILKTKVYRIMVGVAPTIDDTNETDCNNYGWYFNCNNSKLRSGPPHNYSIDSNLGKVKDEIILIMDMKKKSLKFIINNEDKGESYNDIPTDSPIAPAVLLCDENDSVEISKC